jgi:23S rRNA pseudouridine2605 synthase
MHRMRLNAYLARAGVASRRKADELIKTGRVTVNGEPGQLNTFVSSRDRVELDGRELSKEPLAYVLLHKPAGVVTTASDPHGRPTVVGLVAEQGTRLVPVGRLDADTTGALLLTNDGELAHRLAHPRYEVEKVYDVEVDGEPSDEVLRQLEQGIDLDDGRTAPARVRRLARKKLELSIHEGRKHQVKRMLATVGHPVTRLHRSRYAGLTVEGLEPGAWRELEPFETERLRSSPQELGRGRSGAVPDGSNSAPGSE